MQILDALRTNALLAGLDDSALVDLAGRITVLELAEGELLFREGDPGDAVFLVIAGSVQVFAERNGRERVVATFVANSFLGELALLGAVARTAAARAAAPTTVARIDRDIFTALTTAFPIVMSNIGHALVRNLVSTTRALVEPPMGELIAIATDDLEAVATWLPVLRFATGILDPGTVAFVIPDSAGPGAHILDEHLVSDSGNRSAITAWAYATTPDARASLSEIVQRHADEFCRAFRRTVVVGSFTDLMTALLENRFNRVFAVCANAASLEQVAALSGACTLPVEVVPLIRSSAERGTWHALTRRSALGQPTIWIAKDEYPGPEMDEATVRHALGTMHHPWQRGCLRLARAITERRVGVAFGAGGARGFAHIGVFRYFEERGIPVDAFAGSSIGSLVAAGHAMGIDSHHAEAMLSQWLQGGHRRVLRPALSRHSLLSGHGLDRTCRDLFGDARFADLNTPLAISVADLTSGRGLVVRSGTIWKAVRASCSIPAIFPPVVIGERVLVDGGVCDPVPTASLRPDNVDVRIAVNISYSPDDISQWADEEGFDVPRRAQLRQRRPNALETYHASFGMALSDKAALSSGIADVVVRPRFRATAWHDFASGPDQLRRGYDAARHVDDELIHVMPWLDRLELRTPLTEP